MFLAYIINYKPMHQCPGLTCQVFYLGTKGGSHEYLRTPTRQNPMEHEFYEGSVGNLVWVAEAPSLARAETPAPLYEKSKLRSLTFHAHCVSAFPRPLRTYRFSYLQAGLSL